MTSGSAAGPLGADSVAGAVLLVVGSTGVAGALDAGSAAVISRTGAGRSGSSPEAGVAWSQ
ncbi:MAG: hypothetical protein ABWY56_12775, partial [Propionibacteriaceae bacterium]